VGQSNVTMADQLKGHLLVEHGDIDDNVHPVESLRLVDALMKANKNFDMLLVPNMFHGESGDHALYLVRRRWDYFVQYLLGVTPPKNFEIKEDRPPGRSPRRRRGYLLAYTERNLPRRACTMKTFILFVFLIAASLEAGAVDSGVAMTPPMGWNSWNHFACKVTADDVRSAADAIASNGMKDAGYTYVNIDDCWQGTRDEQGRIRPNQKFPDMKALVDYVHAKGLKIGIYSSPGPKTCAGYEGSYGHEEQDAQQYTGWGFDYLKYDWCSAEKVYQRSQMQEVYNKMHDALARTGRPIVFSLCQYGYARVWQWGVAVGGNLWRTTEDISDHFDRMSVIGFDQDGLESFAGPGHWNDPDMLEVGNGGMNHDEYTTHMSLWVLLAAPLLAGNDLSKMTPETLDLLTNKEVIAVDQDAKGVQGRRVAQEGPLEVWAKPLADGGIAVGLFNRGESGNPVTIRFKDIGIEGSAKVRNLWMHKDLGSFNGSYTAEIPRHGAVLIKIQ
jgi:alpha-galactosidase